MNCKYASTCTRRYAPTCILLYLAKWYWRMQVGAYLPCWCVFAGRLVRICHVGAYSLCWCVISKVGLYILNVASYILNVEYLVIMRSIHRCQFSLYLSHQGNIWLSLSKTSRDRKSRWCHLCTIPGTTPHRLVSTEGNVNSLGTRGLVYINRWLNNGWLDNVKNTSAQSVGPRT